jgi:hypothetical protein
VTPGELAAGVVGADPLHRRDPFRPALVVIDVVVEGLLDLDLQSKGISRDGSTVQMSDARDALGGAPSLERTTGE